MNTPELSRASIGARRSPETEAAVLTATAELIRRINRTHTVVVVEHDMTFIQALDCHVTVLHEGSVLAEGSLPTVQANPQVIEVYLGR